MSETYRRFMDVLRRHLAGQADRGGVTSLDVLLANAEAEDLAPELWQAHTLQAIRDGDVTVGGFWSAIRLILKRLELKSQELSSAIETRLVRESSRIDPFDAYEGWRCLVDSGGYLSVKTLHSLTQIKQHRAPLWLDLAILAHQSDSAGLGQVIRELASAKLITLRDIKPRLSDLQRSFGQRRFISQMRQLASNLSSDEQHKFEDWIEQKLGVRLNARDPEIYVHPKSRTWTNRNLTDALSFGLQRREPAPILAMAAG